MVLLLLSGVVEAHSGRTDSSGGHHDYKNKSGLGSYHYHCGGYPPHLHDGGVCPYDTSFEEEPEVYTPKPTEKAKKHSVTANDYSDEYTVKRDYK